jgi:hypothetical protein
VFLGSHTDEEEAARSYDRVAINRNGLQALTNFPLEQYPVDELMATPLPELVAEQRGQAGRKLDLHQPAPSLSAGAAGVTSHLPELLGLGDDPPTPRVSSRRVKPSAKSLRARGMDEDEEWMPGGGAKKKTRRGHAEAQLVAEDDDGGSEEAQQIAVEQHATPSAEGPEGWMATPEPPLSPQDAAVTLLQLLQNA